VAIWRLDCEIETCNRIVRGTVSRTTFSMIRFIVSSDIEYLRVHGAPIENVERSTQKDPRDAPTADPHQGVLSPRSFTNLVRELMTPRRAGATARLEIIALSKGAAALTPRKRVGRGRAIGFVATSRLRLLTAQTKRLGTGAPSPTVQRELALPYPHRVCTGRAGVEGLGAVKIRIIVYLSDCVATAAGEDESDTRKLAENGR
jgi:hypothetical protein